MPWLLDLLYVIAATVTSPIWLFRMARTGKIRTDWPGRFGRVQPRIPAPASGRQRLLFHAVSVGEVNAIRQLVERLAGEFDIVIATTTDTGFARAQALWGTSPHRIVRYPYDFSWAVSRFLNDVRPSAVALTELEVWPNFTAACQARGVPVCVINGRLTERSFKRYRVVKWIMHRPFARLAFAAVQNDAYAARFKGMGAAADRVHVAGTMKWDTAQVADRVEGADRLAQEMGIDRSRPLIVAGSTAPGEHELLHAATPAGVQLLCAPRKPEWFDQAASALPNCNRRTSANPKTKNQNPRSDRFLLDTIGELRMAYALADLVVIGRSFGDLHGSDMMEPAALGKAVIVGPAVRDFQDTVDALRAGDGIVQITPDQLPQTIARLLDDPARRRQIADNARRVIQANQGATERHAQLIRDMLARTAAAKNPPPQRGAGAEVEEKEERLVGEPRLDAGSGSQTFGHHS